MSLLTATITKDGRVFANTSRVGLK